MKNFFTRAFRYIKKKFKNKDKEEIFLINKENKSSLEFAESKIEKYYIIEQFLSEIKFTDWSLSKSSIRYFLSYILENNSNNKKINIIEFGSGASTLFFDKIYSIYNFKYFSLEHDQLWFNKLKKKLKNTNIINCDIKLLSDSEFNDIFNFKDYEAINKFEKYGKLCDKNDYRNTSIRNTFYALSKDFINNLPNFSGIILDGPHGNGRSLVFPLFYKLINNGTVILIDDYTHYPYLDYLKKIFDFDVLISSITKNKKWIIVKIKNKSLK
ncbi:MAG: hypothetical protein KatS3mg068_0901 [Candidatus Sericytochromatia bacterium]|nr:MAG: hypothetical protein KatS3mg068_0901 [Candidatus Sericytochromatia bacterium]